MATTPPSVRVPLVLRPNRLAFAFWGLVYWMLLPLFTPMPVAQPACGTGLINLQWQKTYNGNTAWYNWEAPYMVLPFTLPLRGYNFGNYSLNVKYRYSFNYDTNSGYWLVMNLTTNTYGGGFGTSTVFNYVTGNYEALPWGAGLLSSSVGTIVKEIPSTDPLEFETGLPDANAEIVVSFARLIPTNRPCVYFEPQELYVCLSNAANVAVTVVPTNAQGSISYELIDSAIAQISNQVTNLTVIGQTTGRTTLLAKLGTNVLATLPVTVCKVEFPTNTISVSKGGSWSFGVTVEPSDAPIGYTSSDTNIALISGTNSTFTMTGIELGTIQIKAKIGTNDLCDSAVGKVVNQTNITIVANSYVCENRTTPVWVDLIPADALPGFSLDTDNSSVATISGGSFPNFYASGVNYSNTVIQGKVGTNIFGTNALTVVRVNFPTQIEIGQFPYSLEAEVLPAGAPVTYTSVTPTVALAAGSGTNLALQGIVPGTAEIRALIGGSELCASVGITVTNSLSVTITVNPFICVNGTKPFSYSVTPPNPSPPVTFTTENSAIAVVTTNLSGDHFVTGLAAGRTKIVAKQGADTVGKSLITIVGVTFQTNIAGKIGIPVNPDKPSILAVTVFPEDAPVTYSTDDDKVVRAGGSGTNLMLWGKKEGLTKLFARIGSDQLCTNTLVLATNSCTACACEFGEAEVNLNSIDLAINLGRAAGGQSAGAIYLREATPSSRITSAESLVFVGKAQELEPYYSYTQLRQVRTPQGLVDIQQVSSTLLRLQFFWTNGLGATWTGPYATNGLALMRTITLQSASTNFDTINVTQEAGLLARAHEFSWNSTSNNWRLIQGYRMEELSTVWNTNQTVRTDLRSIYNYTNGQMPVLVAQSRKISQVFGWGTAVVEEGSDPADWTRCTRFSYDGLGRLSQVLRDGGSWEKRAYDTRSRITKRYSAYRDTAPTTNLTLCRLTTYDYRPLAGSGDDGNYNPDAPRTVIDFVLGQEISRRYLVYTTNETREIRCAIPGAAWNATSNMVTVTKRITGGDYDGEIQSVLNPDGTFQWFEYAAGTNGVRIVTSSAGAPNGSFTGVADGVKTISIYGASGEILSVETRDVLTDVVLSRETSSNFDAFGRAQRTTYLDGSYREVTYGCCGVESETDRSGATTVYSYDVLKQRVLNTRNGITVSNAFDAAGNLTASARIGSDGSIAATAGYRYDLAGRMTHQTNAVQQVTTFFHALDSQGRRVETTLQPDGGTRINSFYRDGLSREIGGTAEFPIRYESGVELVGGTHQEFQKVIKLSTSGGTDEWTKIYSDSLGRAYKTVFPDGASSQSFYNSKGQIVKRIDPDGVTTLFEYDLKGEQIVTVLDVNRNGVKDLAGDDRITSNVRDVVPGDAQTGTPDLLRSTTYVWSNSGDTNSALAELQLTTVTGDKAWFIAFGLTNLSESFTGTNGWRTNVTTAPDLSTVTSFFQNGRLLGVVRRDAAGAQVSGVNYSYDEHGRQSEVTDSRSGATTYSYDSANRVVTVALPPHAQGQSRQVTTNFYDSMGRMERVGLPDGTFVTNVYYLNGLLQRQFGSRTYPVQYTYDAQGRMTKLQTWKNFASDSGQAVTSWNYDPQRGFVTAKRYPDNQGPTYTYSPSGRFTSRTWARGVTVTNTYNGAGELATVAYDDGVTPGMTNSYDRRGRQIEVLHGTNRVNLLWTDSGQLAGETNSAGLLTGLAVISGFDSLQRRSTLSLQGVSATPTGYGYDAASRLRTVTHGTLAAIYTYATNSSLISSVVFQNNGTPLLSQSRNYDQLNRLSHIGNSTTNGQSFSAYAYNVANQRTSSTNGSSYWIYQYDDLGQVTSGRRYWFGGLPVAGQQFEYGFDSVGNRVTTANGGNQSGGELLQSSYFSDSLNAYTSRTVPASFSVAGEANTNVTVTVNSQSTTRYGEYYWTQLAVTNSQSPVWLPVTNLAVLAGGGPSGQDLQVERIGHRFVPATPEFYTYDADGNLTSDGRWQYTWDGENRLTRIEANTNLPAGARRLLEFAYDYSGRRIQKRSSRWDAATEVYTLESNRKFLYDGWNLVVMLDVGGAILQKYIWGTDLSGEMQEAGGVGGLLALVDQQVGTSGVYCYEYDGNGNIVGLVNSTDGAQVAAYEFGPFGELTRVTGLMAGANSFRFSTKFQDNETGLLYYGFRYYNPTTGAWLSRDPVQEDGGINLYGFVKNRAPNLYDILGLSDNDDPQLAGLFIGKLKGIRTKFGKSKSVDLIGFNQAISEMLPLSSRVKVIRGKLKGTFALYDPNKSAFIIDNPAVPEEIIVHESAHAVLHLLRKFPQIGDENDRVNEGIAYAVGRFYNVSVYLQDIENAARLATDADHKTLSYRWKGLWKNYGGLPNGSWGESEANGLSHGIDRHDLANVEKYFKIRLSCKKLADLINRILEDRGAACRVSCDNVSSVPSDKTITAENPIHDFLK